MKKCTICRISKPRSEFNKNKTKRDGLQSLCRECSKKRSKVYYAANTEKHKRAVKERKRRLKDGV